MSELGYVYQASDLAGARRRAFIEDARKGSARLRDTDGTPLLLLPEGRYRALADLRDWMLAYLTLESAMRRPRDHRRTEDLGPLAWADVFDADDLEEFRREFSMALSRAVASQRVEPVEQLVGDWARTARALEDDDARKILTGEHDEEDFVEVGPPAPTVAREEEGRDGQGDG